MRRARVFALPAFRVRRNDPGRVGPCDSKKYASTGGWGFGRFVDGKAADEQQHGTCFPCHEANVKGNDFVFTRYAP